MKKLPFILLGLLCGSGVAVRVGAVVMAVEDYGTADPISYQQAASVHYLAWPQSRGAIISRLGYPNAYDRHRDYYDLPDGSYISIRYDGRTAIGFGRSF